MNPRVPLASHTPVTEPGGGLFRVGAKYLSGPDSLGRALKWGIILERPVERWERGEFRRVDWEEGR
jgi:hypothetical protein